MEVDFLVRVSGRMDFFCRVKIFHRSSQIVFFFQQLTKHPVESDKIGIRPCSRVRMGFTQQLQLLVGFLSPFLKKFDYPKICLFFEVVERGSE